MKKTVILLLCFYIVTIVQAKDHETIGFDHNNMRVVVDVHPSNLNNLKVLKSKAVVKNKTAKAAQNVVSKTVSILTPGTLSNVLTASELTTVTNLAITGSIDTRDFKTMRDYMTVLAVIDINSVTIVSYQGYEGTNNSNAIYNQFYPANTIPNRAFHYYSSNTGKTSLTSIILPYSITAIGNGAFDGVTSLTSIKIPSSVAGIGDDAFWNCSSLNSIELPPTLQTIGSTAFKYCTSLVTIVLPPTLQTIGSRTFENCMSIDSISIPSSVKSIGELAFLSFGGRINVQPENQNFSSIDGILFNKPKSLLIQCPATRSGEYLIPSTVQTIGYGALWGTNLTSVTIPSTVKSIKSSAFESCEKLISIINNAEIDLIEMYTFLDCSSLESVNIPPSVISIGEGAFGLCTKLASITLPPSVKSIEILAFSSCTKLASITIPPSVLFIGQQAFGECSSLISINIPSSVTKIDVYAFYLCSALIIVDPDNINYSSLDGLFFNKSKTKLIHCPISKTGSYNIPTSVKKIEDYSFYSSVLSSIIIPSSVDSIGYSSFGYCIGLSSIDIPSSVTSIGAYAFYYSSYLNTVNIPASVPSIGYLAFYACYGLKSIIMNGYPPEMYGDPFYNLNLNNCTLTVPYGSKGLYASALKWCDFTKVVEKPQGFIINRNSILLNSDSGRYATVKITSNVAWSVSPNATWLKIEPNSGMSDTIFTLQTEANSSFSNRTAILTFSSEGSQSQSINVTQRGSMKTIQLSSPGTLSISLSQFECKSTSVLKLIGQIDARDIKCLRDEMPALSYLDLSETTIMYYKGTNGTRDYNETYGANEMPEYSFYAFNFDSPKQNTTLNSILLPNTVTTIGTNAFLDCIELTSIVFPKCVTSISESAFNSCRKLTDICLPYLLNSIGRVAFGYCSELRSLSIPSGVVSIGEGAFTYCGQLNTIYACSAIPIDLRLASDVFLGINKSKCTLYVQLGTINAYKNAIQWKDFTNILEMKNFAIYSNDVSIVPIGSTTSINITSNTSWEVSSDQKWLSTSLSKGMNNAIITLSGLPNNTTRSRMAIVTFRPTGAAPQSFYVNQAAGILSVSRTMVNLTDYNRTSTIEITSNTDWTTNSDKEWLKVTPITGSGNDFLSLKANVNQTPSTRTAEVTVTIPVNGATQTITLTQVALYILNPIIVKKWNDVLICNNNANLFVSYQWYKDNVIIKDATYQYYYQPKGLSGSYFVEVSDHSGKRGLSNTIDISTSLNSNYLNLYPNPVFTSKIFILEIDLSKEELNDCRIKIYSVNGETIRKIENLQRKMSLQINIQGTYILQLQSKDGIVKEATKFIVNH